MESPAETSSSTVQKRLSGLPDIGGHQSRMLPPLGRNSQDGYIPTVGKSTDRRPPRGMGLQKEYGNMGIRHGPFPYKANETARPEANAPFGSFGTMPLPPGAQT